MSSAAIVIGTLRVNKQYIGNGVQQGSKLRKAWYKSHPHFLSEIMPIRPIIAAMKLPSVVLSTFDRMTSQ